MQESTPKVIKFWSHKQPFFEFSNFYRAVILVDGRQWPTTEHYFQSQKFTDEKLQEMIRRQPTPRAAADAGRNPELPLRPDWEEVKESVMAKAIAAKFEQHPRLRDLLLGTGNAVLVEDSPFDNYWGVGRNGKGQNRLGVLLNQVREKLRMADRQSCDETSTKPGMKVIIAGSRSIVDYARVKIAIEASGFEIAEVVSGKALGVDSLGERWAGENNIPVKPFPADWNDLSHPDAVIKTGRSGRKYDAKAGYRRNRQMAEYGDALILVWDGESSGSSDMLKNAEELGLKIHLDRPEPAQMSLPSFPSPRGC